MWESHYSFSNINFNSVSALRISILLLSRLKNFIIFFKIQPSLGINNNIILRINISMDSVFLLIDIFILRIILLLLPKEGLIVKKIIKFFKLLKRRIDILNAEAELKFILENK